MVSKLYAIIYVFGKVSAVVGPWPENSVIYCEQIKVTLEQHIDSKFELIDPDDPIWIVDGKKITRNDYHTRCEIRDNEPAISEFTLN